jgi:leucyl/phenylalanyl-tRNA--protein transferase
VHTLTWLSSKDLNFPPAHLALKQPNGLLAAGGDLTSERLIAAYRQGIFPWFDKEPVLWWHPDPRAVLYPDGLKISRSLTKTLNQEKFTLTLDQCFGRVIKACAALTSKRPETWINQHMVDAYLRLHQLGIAHSVEVWQQGQLCGGLYGLAIGQVFFGESMFSQVRDASKVALVKLTRQLKHWGYGLIDCQVSSRHLQSLGAQDIPRQDFIQQLNHYVNQPGQANTPWSFN